DRHQEDDRDIRRADRMAARHGDGDAGDAAARRRGDRDAEAVRAGAGGDGEVMVHAGGLFPSPLWGGVRGGGRSLRRERRLSRWTALPPSPTLPHKGGGSGETEPGTEKPDG